MAQVKMASEKMALVMMAHGLVGKSVLRSFRKVLFSPNDFPQISHLKFFSPECTTLCLVKVLFWLNDFPQISHLKFFSPECTTLLAVKLRSTPSDFPQTFHLRFFSPEGTTL